MLTFVESFTKHTYDKNLAIPKLNQPNEMSNAGITCFLF